MSHDRICTSNVSDVRINGNVIEVGALPQTPMMASDLVLGRVCSSHVKVVFWHVSERINLQVSVSGYKLVM